MTTRALLIAFAASALAGCFLLHRHRATPQQQMIDALNRGNSAQAADIWLHMTPEDQSKFRRGEGIAPAVPPEQAMKALSEQQLTGEEGQVTIGPHGGSLLDLPSIAPPPSPGSPPPSP
jgi:hypothetical protein